MTIKNRIVCCSIALLALPVLESFAGPADFQVALIKTFDYPEAVVSTQPQKISDRGAIVGVIADVNAVQSGFVRFPNGRYSAPLVDPSDTGNTTQGRGINASYLICGDYLDGSTGLFSGFFGRGTGFHNYDVPGSTFTILLGINNAGDFCGSDIPASGVQSGFASIGRVVTEFTVPGSASTLAYQINSSDQVAGYYTDADGVTTHGYYRDSDGSIVAPIDPAGSIGTIVFGNNDNNYIVGRFADAAGLTHAFVFVAPDTYVVYDFPGSTFTSFNGINRVGAVVGRYLDDSGIEHGLLAQFTAAPGRPGGGTIPQRYPAQVVNPVKVLPSKLQIVEPAL